MARDRGEDVDAKRKDATMQNPNGNRPPKSPLTGPGGERDPNKRGPGGTPAPRRPRVPPWIVGLLLLSILGWYLYQYFGPEQDPDRTTIPYSTFLSQIDGRNIKEATVSSGRIDAELNQGLRWDKENERVVANDAANASEFDPVTRVRTTIPPPSRESNDALVEQLTASGAVIKGKSDDGSLLTGLLISFLPVLLFLGLIVFMGRQMSRGQQNVFGFGRSAGPAARPGAAAGDLRRRRRRGRGQAGADGGRRLPAQPGRSTISSARGCRAACCWSVLRAPARR